MGLFTLHNCCASCSLDYQKRLFLSFLVLTVTTFKGTVSVNLGDLPFKSGMCDLQRYPLYLCLIKDFVGILIYMAGN